MPAALVGDVMGSTQSSVGLFSRINVNDLGGASACMDVVRILSRIVDLKSVVIAYSNGFLDIICVII